MKKIAFYFTLLILLCSLASCKRSKLDNSIFQDLTAEDVLSINEEIPTFRFFYDNIRAKIVAKSNDYDRVQYEKVTYKSMYDMFNYWESAELKEMINDCISTYNDEMASYQKQIDSISDTYRSIIDKIKVKGAPEYDYAKIFKHPVIYCFDRSNGYTTTISFSLPIKDQQLFDQVGFKGLTIVVHLMDKRNLGKELFISTGVVQGRGYRCICRNNMKLYNDYQWALLDPTKDNRYMMWNICNSWDGLPYPSYNSQLTPQKNFENSFDWYYEVENCAPSYKKYLQATIPEKVYSYWMWQEGTSEENYVDARNEMIREYCNKNFHPLWQTLPITIENEISLSYPDEYALYEKAKSSEKTIREFESMFDKYVNERGKDWISPDITLPISNPNGNYVAAAEYESRIPRDSSIVFSDNDDTKRRPGESYASYVERMSKAGKGIK